MLRDLLAEEHQLEARDRVMDERGDDVDLAGGSDPPFDQIWLFAVDVANALTAADVAGIEAFRRGGGPPTRDTGPTHSCFNTVIPANLGTLISRRD